MAEVAEVPQAAPQGELALLELFRDQPREAVNFFRTLLVFGTFCSVATLAVCCFPVLQSAHTDTAFGLALWWWLALCALVQALQLPLRFSMHRRLWMPVQQMPRQAVIQQLGGMVRSLEWRLNKHFGNIAHALFLGGSFLTSFARHLGDAGDKESLMLTAVTVSVVALAARIAFSFCWFFFSFVYRNDMPAVLGRNGRAADDGLIRQRVKFFKWEGNNATAATAATTTTTTTTAAAPAAVDADGAAAAALEPVAATETEVDEPVLDGQDDDDDSRFHDASDEDEDLEAASQVADCDSEGGVAPGAHEEQEEQEGSEEHGLAEPAAARKLRHWTSKLRIATSEVSDALRAAQEAGAAVQAQLQAVSAVVDEVAVAATASALARADVKMQQLAPVASMWGINKAAAVVSSGSNSGGGSGPSSSSLRRRASAHHQSHGHHHMPCCKHHSRHADSTTPAGSSSKGSRSSRVSATTPAAVAASSNSSANPVAATRSSSSSSSSSSSGSSSSSSSSSSAAAPDTPTCAVCLTDFETGDDAAQLPCSPVHVFHRDCVIPWLKVQKRCPLCTQDIDEPQFS